jgi:hypothetical protein
VKEFSIGGKKFKFNSQPAVMGVVNLSADSWYRESVCLTAEMAVQRGKVLHAQGADIIDVGAESTLAHATHADDDAQESKLIPVIKKLRASKHSRFSRNLFNLLLRARLFGGWCKYFEPDRNRRLRKKFLKWSPHTTPPSSSVSCRAKTSAKSAISI